jgi:DNA topoisomerase I
MGSMLCALQETQRNPSPPFTTSTLQQAASQRLGLGAAATMSAAQTLYEGGDGLGYCP